MSILITQVLKNALDREGTIATDSGVALESTGELLVSFRGLAGSLAETREWINGVLIRAAEDVAENVYEAKFKEPEHVVTNDEPAQKPDDTVQAPEANVTEDVAAADEAEEVVERTTRSSRRKAREDESTKAKE